MYNMYKKPLVFVSLDFFIITLFSFRIKSMLVCLLVYKLGDLVDFVITLDGLMRESIYLVHFVLFE